MTAPRPFDRWSSMIPIWWVVLAWVAMTVATVMSVGHGRFGMDQMTARILAGVLFTAGALAVQSASERFHVGPPAVGVVIATVAGLATVAIGPSGLGEVPIYMVAGRIPYAFGERAARLFVVASTAGTSVAVGLVSHSWAGFIAGVGVPFLTQRAVDRRALVQQRDRAEALLVEAQAGREAEAQAAALRERGRIAREMHDVLAHSLAGLSLQLQAARVIAQKRGVGTEVLEPLDRAASLARDGLAEAKSAVGALNDPARRGVAQLADLADAQPGVHLTVTGQPGALGPDADHAVYRVVQESLTNAMRYAPGSSVQVRLAWQPDELAVAVRDAGPAAGHVALPAQGTGLGLSGMRERIAAVGGSVASGPDGSGWRVDLTVPTREGSP